jgi:hemerythrin superfamily protein
MNSLQMLRRQHRDIEALFHRMEQTADGEARQRLLQRLARHIEVHLRMEEEVLYPAVWDLGTRRARGVVAGAYEGHAAIKIVLEELASIDEPAERFAARLAAFRDLVDNHVAEEEAGIFPVAQALGKDTLTRLAQEIAAKSEAAHERASAARAA